MQRAQLALVGGNDLYSDMFEVHQPEETGKRGDKRVSLKDAVATLRIDVEEAISHMESDWHPEWENAQHFWNGESEVKLQEGRSQARDTVVRDHIRSVKPSCMRSLMASSRVVEFKPYNEHRRVTADMATQQTFFVNQRFWATGGYMLISDGFHDSLLKNGSVMRLVDRESYKYEYIELTDAPEDIEDQLGDQDEFVFIESEEDDWRNSPVTGITATIAKLNTTRKIGTEHVALHNFFISDDATSPEDARVVGESCDITVSDARSMGLDVKAGQFDSRDNELRSSAGESEARRGYVKRGTDSHSTSDPTQAMFLLTECYARFDLDGLGMDQLYRFYLGGSSYGYISHERVEEVPYVIGTVDPRPNSAWGWGYYDILKEDQNTGTSMLRATLDNAHSANNRRLAVNDSIANMADVLSTKVGAPIRVRGPNAVTEVGTAPSTGAMLPILQHLERRAENKTGVTQAAAGLDPDSLQSTDKDAARHTAMLGQGQVELLVRNFVETGIGPLARKLLRAAIKHYDELQYITDDRGNTVEVDISNFDPDIELMACVGLGTGEDESKFAALQMMATKQERVIEKFGLSNPICGLPQLFNTYTDMAAIRGVTNIGRYFNEISPEVSQQLEKMVADAEAARQPEPPSKAIVHAEMIKGQSGLQRTQLEIAAKKEADAKKRKQELATKMMDDDLKRDQMAQDLAISSAQLSQSAVDENAVRTEQRENDLFEFEDFLDQLVDEMSRNSPVTTNGE